MFMLHKEILYTSHLSNFILLIFYLIMLHASAVESATKITTVLLQEHRKKDFVDVIKEDLRRNNDDYKDFAEQNRSHPYSDSGASQPTTQVIARNLTNQNKTAVGKQEKFYYRKGSENMYSNKNNIETIKDDVKRRAYDTVDSLDISNLIKNRKSNTIKPENFIKNETKIEIKDIKTQDSEQKFSTVTTKNHMLTHDFVKDKQPKNVNEEKSNKIKMFLTKNKGLLNDFISSQNLATQAIKMRAIATNDMETSSSSSERDSKMLPDPDQMDMAPAKGARIHSMRLKGRLCQRSVLFPEGPKYDSKGVQYLAAHAAAAAHGRDFSQTRNPLLVLPKCCNCCKKSVLGCE